MNNEIIDVEYREAMPTGERLCEITAEIKYISEQMNKTLLTGIIEIGRRFDAAKRLVEHGKWGEWCEKCTNYKQSMAENYIKAYKEYGDEQISLFGDLSKSQSLGNLGITKLIELTAIPAEEREDFVEKNNVTEDTTVVELRELIKKQKADIESAEEKAQRREKELSAEIEKSLKKSEQAQSEIERLTREIDKLKSAKTALPDSELEKMIADAEKAKEKELANEIERLRGEKERAEEKADKVKKKLDRLNDSMKAKDEQLEKLAEQKQRSDEEKTELKSIISRLQKESLLGANENMVRLNLCFEGAQSSISQLKTALDGVRNSDNYEKLVDAISGQLGKMVNEL